MIICIYIGSSETHSQNGRKVYRIEDCISADDVQYQMSLDTKRVISKVETSEKIIRYAAMSANKRINTAWLDSYEKVLRISTNLHENLNHYTKRNLESSKFHYYTSLWYRSMLAADIVYKEYKEIDACLSEFNRLILDIKNGKNPGLPKSQIHDAKDSIKDLRSILLSKVKDMNQNTARLRDKVGNECGERGARWRAERMRH